MYVTEIPSSPLECVLLHEVMWMRAVLLHEAQQTSYRMKMFNDKDHKRRSLKAGQKWRELGRLVLVLELPSASYQLPISLQTPLIAQPSVFIYQYWTSRSLSHSYYYLPTTDDLIYDLEDASSLNIGLSISDLTSYIWSDLTISATCTTIEVAGAEGDLSGIYTYDGSSSYVRRGGSTSYILGEYNNDEWRLGQGFYVFSADGNYPHYYVSVLLEHGGTEKRLSLTSCYDIISHDHR